MRTVTLTVEPFSAGLRRFKDTFEAVQAGRPVEPREVVGFTSLEAARNFLTRERRGLLRTIKTRRPRSIYELARLVGRDLKNVQQDIRILERHGLVRIASARGEPAPSRCPGSPSKRLP